MRRRKRTNEECPVARSIDVIGDRWSLLIVRDAFDGMRRFGEFQRDLRLSKSVLATRLRSLVAAGVLKITPGEDGSAYQEYALTEKGRDLFYVIVGLRKWGEEHLFTPDEPHSIMVDTRSGRPIGNLALQSKDGRSLLDWSNTVVQKVAGTNVSKRLRS